MGVISRVKTRSNKFIIAAAMLVAYVSCIFAADLPGFRVAGRYLYDKCGEKVILRGVSKMIVWTDINGASFPEIAKTGANCVRIVWTTSGDIAKFDAAIQACHDNKMIPMVELHDATGNWSLLSTCVDWWVKPEVVSILQKHEEYLLINIANECGQEVSDADFKTGYTNAITRMRTAGIHVPLVIDASQYGQNIKILQTTGPDLITADPDHNVLLSVHMWWPKEYGYSDASITDGIAQCVKMNLPLIVGEFGNTAAKCVGAINYKLIIKTCQENEIGWLAWEWGPGNSDCTSMDMTTDSKFETLRDWGLEVCVTDQNSIKNTSVRPYFMVNNTCQGSQTTRFSVSVMSKGRGSVTISPNKVMVDSGTTLTFTAVADANNEFKNWSGSADGTQNPLTITVNKNVNLTAEFSDNGPAVGAELITNGDFSKDTSGWSFEAYTPAVGTASVADGALVINMTTQGTDGWYAQLKTLNLDIQKGKSYVVSFKAKADQTFSLSTNVGQNEDPWATYSGYQKFSVGTEMKQFTYDFVADTSNRKSRMVFDLGTLSGKIYFDDISLKPVENTPVKKTYYGSQAQKAIYAHVKNDGNFTMITSQAFKGAFEIIDISGKCVAQLKPAMYTPGSYTMKFPINALSSGTYFVRLVSSNIKFVSSPVSIIK